jgi:hypothetical protein
LIPLSHLRMMLQRSIFCSVRVLYAECKPWAEPVVILPAGLYDFDA